MRLLAALAALTILGAACGGGTPAPTGAGGRTIEVTMTEFTFSPSTIALRPGEKVTLRFKNIGTLEHEFMAGLRAVPGKGFTEDWIAKAATNVPSHTHVGEEHTGQGVRVSADWYGSLTVVVPDETGEYEFACFVQGHYEAGMRGRIVVSAR
jgi:uncharacterized cupredoxin-like copper-binding protein